MTMQSAQSVPPNSFHSHPATVTDETRQQPTNNVASLGSRRVFDPGTMPPCHRRDGLAFGLVYFVLVVLRVQPMNVSTGTTMSLTPGRYCALSDKLSSRVLLRLRRYLLVGAVKGSLGYNMRFSSTSRSELLATLLKCTQLLTMFTVTMAVLPPYGTSIKTSL